MLDLSHIPDSQQDVKIFYAGPSWQTWTKPKKCQWVWIMCIGGGGGGAAGTLNNSSSPTGGGSGAVTRAMFNASHLPDTLFIFPGIGGVGGSISGGTGVPGGRSFVSISVSAATTNIILASGTVAATGGTGNGSVVGSGETAFTTTQGAFATLSTFSSTAGQSSPGPNGPQWVLNVIPLNSQITCAGASGGGIGVPSFAPSGAPIPATSISPLIPGGTGTTAAATNGGNGGSGYTSWKPFFSLGGSGGGSAISGSGGRGGDGGIGSGGGAGGGSGVVGGFGRGGKGGDGLVVIVAF